jgi:hypothetical protein
MANNATPFSQEFSHQQEGTSQARRLHDGFLSSGLRHSTRLTALSGLVHAISG